MAKLTEKQRQFVANKAAGVPNREAATAAGYSPTSAAVIAANMLQRPHIREAIKHAQESASVTVTPDSSAMPRKHYADAMAFLQDVMNHVRLPVAVRMDAAKNLLPYQHARIGEKGKKEQRQEAAHGVARRGRFTPKQPPTLGVIQGGKE